MSTSAPVTPWPAFELIEQALYSADPQSRMARYLVDLLSRWGPENELEQALAELPALVASAFGADAASALPVSAVWQVMRYAAKLLDDVQDGDAGSQMPIHSNAATALIFVAQIILQKIRPVEVGRMVGQRLARAGLLSCLGQHDDLLAAGVTPDRWLEIAARKSGAAFGWALASGGALAGLGEQQIDALDRAGLAMGILVQIADDYGGVWQSAKASDLAGRQPGLPVAYALSVSDSAQREKLLSHLRAARKGNRRRVGAARKLIVELGGPSFMLAAAKLQEQNLQDSLSKAQCPGPFIDRVLFMIHAIFPLLAPTH